MERNLNVNIWIEKTIVNKKTKKNESNRALGSVLWSPKTGKDGRNTYKNMLLVKPDDVIIHLVNNLHFVGVSLCESEAKEASGIPNSPWPGPAYVIRLKKYTQFESVIPRELILNDINKKQLAIIASKSEVFYNSNITLRQGGYLTPCSLELFGLLNNTYKSINKKDIPYSEKINFQSESLSDIFRINILINSLKEVGFIFSPMLVKRYIASLLTKPFVILSGLSGSGKTKMAQAFAKWICLEDSQYCIVPVGADWTNREPLLGYPNALLSNEYIKPDNGVLDLIIKANNQPELPFFLILDEMNLSHVERYFADFLSVMESKGEISLFVEGTVKNGIQAKLRLPSNLFIVGTVNIDETTYMFSPKVLDRANVIEFRVTKSEIESFFENQKDVDMDELKSKGVPMAKSFLEMAEKREFEEHDLAATHQTLVNFFEQLKKTGAEFGYRSATEIIRLINQLTVIDADLSADEKLDIAIMQKLLPKLHGSRRKLCPVLIVLGGFCINKVVIENIEKEVFAKDDFDFESEGVIYPISLEKITRMYRGAIENGFASYAEA